MTGRESLVNPQLWLAFAIMLFVAGLGNTFPVFFPALLEQFGDSRAATALAVTLFWVGGTSLVGTLCLVGLALRPSHVLVVGYVLFLFLPLGTRASVVSVLVSRVATPSEFGSVFGWLAVRNLSTRMRQSGHEFSVGAPSRSLGSRRTGIVNVNVEPVPT